MASCSLSSLFSFVYHEPHIKAHRSPNLQRGGICMFNSKVPPCPTFQIFALPSITYTCEEDDAFHDECGVFGIYGDCDAARLTYLGLHALQHRGQEGAGITTLTGGKLTTHTGLGLVSEVFNTSILDKLQGNSAIGHVRYSTSGESLLKNIQPFIVEQRFLSFAVAHNGNLVNYRNLRHSLEDKGSVFTTSSDTEIVLHLMALSRTQSLLLRIIDTCRKLEGAYSFVFLAEGKLIAVRDPFGFRPLVMGRRENGATVFSSETCALDLINAQYVREVQPGEVVVVDAEGVSSLCLDQAELRKTCVFELIYFSNPSSDVFGHSVYRFRYMVGRALARVEPVECDVVIAVPDSGVVAALGYAAEANVPFQQGLIRSHYVGRTFIQPTQKIRDFNVKLKLSSVRSVLEGKCIVVVDDSIVRGTTCLKIVRLLKEAGAKEVHMRIASPPTVGSCYYGIDTPSAEELISNKMDKEQLREFIGSESLAFLPLPSLRTLLEEEASHFCDACFSRNYPILPKGSPQSSAL